jgi:hypothetical protein
MAGNPLDGGKPHEERQALVWPERVYSLSNLYVGGHRCTIRVGGEVFVPVWLTETEAAQARDERAEHRCISRPEVALGAFVPTFETEAMLRELCRRWWKAGVIVYDGHWREIERRYYR